MPHRELAISLYQANIDMRPDDVALVKKMQELIAEARRQQAEEHAPPAATPVPAATPTPAPAVIATPTLAATPTPAFGGAPKILGSPLDTIPPPTDIPSPPFGAAPPEDPLLGVSSFVPSKPPPSPVPVARPFPSFSPDEEAAEIRRLLHNRIVLGTLTQTQVSDARRRVRAIKLKGFSLPVNSLLFEDAVLTLLNITKERNERGGISLILPTEPTEGGSQSSTPFTLEEKNALSKAASAFSPTTQEDASTFLSKLDQFVKEKRLSKAEADAIKQLVELKTTPGLGQNPLMTEVVQDYLKTVPPNTIPTVSDIIFHAQGLGLKDAEAWEDEPDRSTIASIISDLTKGRGGATPELNLAERIRSYVIGHPPNTLSYAGFEAWLEKTWGVDTDTWSVEVRNIASQLFTSELERVKGNLPKPPPETVVINGRTFARDGDRLIEIEAAVVPLDVVAITAEYSAFDTKDTPPSISDFFSQLRQKGTIPPNLPPASASSLVQLASSLIAQTSDRLARVEEARARARQERIAVASADYEEAVEKGDWTGAIRLKKEILKLGGASPRDAQIQASLLKSLSDPFILVMAQKTGLIRTWEGLLGFSLNLPDWKTYIRPVNNLGELMNLPESDRLLALAAMTPEGQTPKDFFDTLQRAQLVGPTQGVTFRTGGRRARPE